MYSGKLWIRQMMVSAFFLPALVCGTAFFINFIAIYYHASRAIAFTIMVKMTFHGIHFVTSYHLILYFEILSTYSYFKIRWKDSYWKIVKVVFLCTHSFFSILRNHLFSRRSLWFVFVSSSYCLWPLSAQFWGGIWLVNPTTLAEWMRFLAQSQRRSGLWNSLLLFLWEEFFHSDRYSLKCKHCEQLNYDGSVKYICFDTNISQCWSFMKA